jgi:hypothetical protein
MDRHALLGTLILLPALALADGPPPPDGAPMDIHDLVKGEAKTESTRNFPVFPERLTYEVGWGIVDVGEATLDVAKIVDFDGKPAYAITSEAVSNGFCDKFYKVRDLNESWVDAKTLSSLGYSKKLREGKFFRDEWVLLKDGKFVAKTVNRDGDYSWKSGTAPVVVQDILSSIYFVRGQNLEPGKDISLDVNTKDNWPLMVRVHKKEKVKTPAGKFQTIVVEPAMRKEGIFVQKGKRLRIWLTDDERRIPVMIKVEVFFGNITIALKKIGA